MKITSMAVATAALTFASICHAGLVSESFTAGGVLYAPDGNRLYSSDDSVHGYIGAVQFSVTYDTADLTNCSNTATSSFCTAPSEPGAFTASFTTTTYNNGVQTFTVTGGGASYAGPGPSYSCPEGFCDNLSGGVYLADDSGFAYIHIYTFGADGHYMANGLHTNLAWVNGETATDAAYVNAAIANYNYTDWFYSGAFTSDPGGNGPYGNGPNFAPGNYYNLGGLAQATPEPASLLTLAGGLLAVALTKFRLGKSRG